ncbi:alpha/beta fold hydrolase [Propioniciclava coleopterorum]|uniref:Alpha/beta fold hydrolase n=1 Tax=Propioniciclava coleopterorum TaxID=2714937 RepID=A0A6G7Y822_9ACTN|nr:alpha/beta fold hydrolase [Propioniciclava coleopterorum]
MTRATRGCRDNGGVKKRTGLLLAVILGLLGYGVGLAQPYVLRTPLVVGQDAAVPDAPARVRLAEAGGRVLVVDPAQGDARVAFVLYPGGLVRPQAYEWIGHALAAHGVRTLIPEMPLDLAVLGTDRAERLASELAGGLPVVVGGHSLGGAMAASYAAAHPDAVAGLVLLAAYPPDNADLVDAPFPAVSLLAGNDGVADPDRVRAGVGSLPAGTRLVTVPGAVHSFFGRYGPQAGDGVPDVDRATAEAQITAELVRFFAQVR